LQLGILWPRIHRQMISMTMIAMTQCTTTCLLH